MSIVVDSEVHLDEVSAGILYELWPPLRGRRLRRDYYGNLLTQLRREFTILIRLSRPTENSDVQHVSGHLALLKQNIDKPLSSIFDILKTALSGIHDSEITRLTEFLIRAWLTVELDIPGFAGRLGATTLVRGNENASLRQIIEGRFQSLIPDEKKLTPMSKGTLGGLTMRYLIDKYGWTVSWTSNLMEHLTVNSRAKCVTIYEHKIRLLHHFEFGHLCPIPQEVIQEALDTLNILFPPEDASTQRYLEGEGRPFHLLGSCNREDYRDLAHYRYWHEGLTRLRSVMDEEPPGLRQFVLDRDHRNIRDVTTFWLAVVVVVFLTFGFGIISSVFAAKAYQVAHMQYNLELAQACAAPGAKVSLAQYCV